MRVFVVSDIHADYDVNRRWISGLSSQDYRDDVLVVAGDITDDLRLLASVFFDLAARFRQVLFVPGNHELWVHRDDGLTSLEKFGRVSALAEDHGISMNTYGWGSLSIVPLLSWYDFSFGAPREELRKTWADFRACVWPPHFSVQDVNSYFLAQNVDRLRTRNRTVISFSHFLPRIDLMPAYIPAEKRLLYPVLGSDALREQVEKLRPTTHVYGHSHVNRRVELDGIRYVNNAFGYPSETMIASRSLLCLYDEGVICEVEHAVEDL